MKKSPIDRIDSILKAHAKRCAYCGAPFVFGEGKTIDHISPKSKNEDESGRNKVVVCQRCNSIKSNMTFSVFKEIAPVDNIKEYCKDFGDLQLPTGEHYARLIQKRFGIGKDEL